MKILPKNYSFLDDTNCFAVTLQDQQMRVHRRAEGHCRFKAPFKTGSDEWSFGWTVDLTIMGFRALGFCRFSGGL